MPQIFGTISPITIEKESIIKAMVGIHLVLAVIQASHTISLSPLSCQGDSAFRKLLYKKPIAWIVLFALCFEWNPDRRQNYFNLCLWAFVFLWVLSTLWHTLKIFVYFVVKTMDMHNLTQASKWLSDRPPVIFSIKTCSWLNKNFIMPKKERSTPK